MAPTLLSDSLTSAPPIDVSKIEPCPGSHDLDRPERHNSPLATVESNEGGFERRHHEEPSPMPLPARRAPMGEDEEPGLLALSAGARGRDPRYLEITRGEVR